MAPREKLLVATKQHDVALAQLIRELSVANIERPRLVADAISAHMKANATKQFLEVERWAERTPPAAVPSTGFDATVTSGATTDTTTRTFGRVFEAMQYLDSQGFVTARIGVTSRGSVVTETGVLGAMSNLTSVEVTGVDGLRSGSNAVPTTRWSHGGFSTTGTGMLAWRLFDIQVETGGTKTAFFQGTTVTVSALRARFDGQTGSLQPTITASTSVPSWLFDSETIGCSPGSVQFFDCVIGFNAVTTLSTPAFQAVGCLFVAGGSDTPITVTGTLPLILVGCRFDLITRTITFTSTTGRRVYITGECERTTNGKLTLAISGHTNCHIDIEEGFSATIGASAASAVIGNYIGGSWTAVFDVTGPILCDAVVPRCTVRGKSVTGNLQVLHEASSGTGLTAVGLTDSALEVSARLSPGIASSTQKSFAFDAACLRDVILFSGKNEFPTGGTNVGTKVLIIDEDGIPSSGLPDIITPVGPLGTTVRVPVVTVDAKGRVTALTDVAIAFPASVTKFSTTFGNGVATTFTIAHGLGTGNLMCTIKLTANDEVIYPYTTLDATNIFIDMGATVLAAGGGRVTVG